MARYQLHKLQKSLTRYFSHSLTFRSCPSIIPTFHTAFFFFYTCAPPPPVFTPLTPSFLSVKNRVTPLFTSFRHLPHTIEQTYPPPPLLAVTYPGLECKFCVVVELGPRSGDQCWNLSTETSRALVGDMWTCFHRSKQAFTNHEIYRICVWRLHRVI